MLWLYNYKIYVYAVKTFVIVIHATECMVSCVSVPKFDFELK